MKKLSDVRITKSIINERRELQVNMIVKNGDYDEITAELLRNAKIEWNTLDFLLDGLTLADNEIERKKALQTLILTIKEYCHKFHTSEDDIVKNIYLRYKIKSRSELSLADIQSEIESFKTAIMTWMA